jgi:hypothetical protein
MNRHGSTKINRGFIAPFLLTRSVHFLAAIWHNLSPPLTNVTHNKCYATCGHFADAALDFLRDKVPKNWASFRDSVTDNFRVINPKDFRVLT